LAVTAVAAAPAATPAGFEAIYSRAEVRGPHGRFVTEIVSLADGRARFLQSHAESTSELLVSGGAAFQRPAGGGFESAPAAAIEIVRGHDVPRLALARGGRPERIELPESGGRGAGPIVIELGDWRELFGVALPFRADFVHAGERFEYRYTAILPFRLAPGAPLPADPAALFARLGDLGELVAAHERVMAAHRTSDAAAFAADEAPVATLSGRGELNLRERAATVARMRDYLGSVRFERYADTVSPVVAVAADGTLGWLACEMGAEGKHTHDGVTEPIVFGFSWVELYAREPGAERWLRIGNASSQRP
jgi:hypothetical protein